MAQISLTVEDREAELLGRLPPAARDTFRRLQQSRDDAHGLLLIASAAAREARDDLRTAERDLDLMMRARKRDEVAEEQQKARIAAERVELSRRQRIAAEGEAAWSPVRALFPPLIERLRDAPGRLVEAAVPDVRLRKNETPAQAIEARRARL